MPTTTGKATDFITFSRASLATVTDSDGRIKWAAHNLLLASEQFDASAWTKGGQVTLSANSAVAPNGTTTAERYSTSDGADSSLNNMLQQVTTGPATLTAGIWLRASTNQTVKFQLVDGSTIVTDQTVSVTSTWTLFTISGAITTGTATLWRIRPNGTNAIANLEIWGAHLYRSDLGGMVLNPARGDAYYPTTPRNLLGFTEDFSNAAWNKSNTTVSTNVLVAPNGLQTADALTDNITSGLHGAIQNIAFSSSSTASVYLKAGTGTYAGIYCNGPNQGIFVNLTTGSFSANIVNAPAAYSITPVGDGWYRVSIRTTAASATNVAVYMSDDGSTLSYAGTGKTIYLWGAQLSDSASLDPYISNAFAAPTAAAYHGPRLDYDPVTLAAKGLLVEEQRSNLATYSAQFDDAAWTKTSTTVTGNAAVSPDGGTTAETAATSAANGVVARALTIAADSTTYTMSIFVKYISGSTGFRIRAALTGGTSVAKFLRVNAQTGAFVASDGTYAISDAGNGWYRISLSIANNGSNTLFNYQIYCTDDATSTNTVAIYGAQLETGSFATSYIPTTSATVTRSADVASVATSQFPYSATEGSWVANFQTLFSGQAAASAFILSLDGNNSKRVLYISGGTEAAYNSDGSNILAASGDVTGTISKSASAYDASAKYIVSNGGTVASGSVVAGYSTASTVSLGCLVVANQLNGHIRQITYIPRRLTNAELQARTA